MIETDHNLESRIEIIQEKILIIDLKLQRLDRNDDQFFDEMQKKKSLTEDLKNTKLEKQNNVN